MQKEQLAEKVFDEVGMIARTSDLVSAGLKNHEIMQLCNQGTIERIRRGFYQFPQNGYIKDEELIAMFLPQGVICVESALFYYGYSDFSPRQWSIAVPRSFSRTIQQMQEIPVKAYYIQPEFHELGRVTADFNGITLPVYDKERTICDCFKYRSKLDSELFSKAVKAYAADERKNLRNLSLYAKKMRVYSRLMNIMEVLLTG